MVLTEIKVEGVRIAVENRNDGIYLIVDRPKGNKTKLDFGTLRTLVDDLGVSDWEFPVLVEAVESEDEQFEKIISTNTALKAIDESAVIKVSPDKMQCEIIFLPSKNGGKRMTMSDIRGVIKENRITMGIDEELLEKLETTRIPEAPYVIAAGRKTENGEHGRIEYFFETESVGYKPKELEDGSLDYMNLNLFQVATKGMVLARIYPPTLGIDGYSVMGDVVRATPGKPVLSPVGKNVTLSEDGTEVTANVEGQIVFQNKKINVNPVLEIRGNVDNSTGNINFLGTVVVKGNILSGFSVTTSGDIECEGVVEGAFLTCDGDIWIKGGVQGMEKAILKAQGSVTAKFIENATVVAGVDVNADSIMRSNVKCSGSLNLQGRRGQIIGGSAKVLHMITASVIGSQLEASTEVQAGLDPDLYDEYTEKRAELARVKKEISQLSQIINTLAKAREKGTLTEPKKAILVKSLQSKTHLKQKTTDLFTEIERMIPELTKGTGLISVEKYCNPGVKITIGNAILYVKERMERCTFSNVEGDIHAGPFMSSSS